jgi:hypothetical protein
MVTQKVISLDIEDARYTVDLIRAEYISSCTQLLMSNNYTLYTFKIRPYIMTAQGQYDIIDIDSNRQVGARKVHTKEEPVTFQLTELYVEEVIDIYEELINELTT